MKKIITVLLISYAVLICTGCPEEESDPDFVGTWRYSGSAETTQVIVFSTEGYEFVMITGEGEGNVTATIIEYDEGEGHIMGELDTVSNMGDWANQGDTHYLTYEIDGDVMLATDNFSQGIETYPSSEIFDTGTEGVDYWRFSRMN